MTQPLGLADVEVIMGNTHSKPNLAMGFAKAIGSAIVDIIFGPSSQQDAMTHPVDAPTDVDSLPPLQTEGEVTYVTGGGNYAESLAFCHAEHLWPLTLEFLMSEPGSGNHYDEVQVEIFDEYGTRKLNMVTNGPFMLVKIPPGHYHVKAKLGEQSIGHVVFVRTGRPVKQTFIF